ncbi:hypothetical protein Cob_v001323 [Colletotrichum orbiculare MAFF 240422]|uniref:Uncharacterized protein n=1 Tax=Colletotrichum orbiculare (strain 104-T / ATCC 96160 / CBS 514.97 / LARS 414 / MAFF 240422) TaxID=1213857 RepID=A0A484G592_COLOR|nr:hypothetical protein Cob_v001323 [Colletotrichum orbiculare MAFF 240422]
MSRDSLAAFRKSPSSDDLAALAEKHIEHDLYDSDRDLLKSAAAKVSTHAAIGSVVGLGLGFFLAFRLRRARADMFARFAAKEKPISVQFASGRTEPIPDVTEKMAPTRLGDVATYSLLGLGSLFLGGELGFVSGTASAASSITKDPQSRARIENAFRRFRAEALRKEADAWTEAKRFSTRSSEDFTGGLPGLHGKKFKEICNSTS